MDRDWAFLLDILESARLALSYVSQATEADFLTDVQCQDSVIRRLEIIGEAARRVSSSFQVAHPGLPWHEMTGMRNILIHEYDDVDMHIIWQTVVHELPEVVETVESLPDAPWAP